MRFKEKDIMRTTETNSVVFFNDHEYPQLPYQPIIAAWEIINPENIGSLIRLAGNLGLKEVFILGDELRYKMNAIRRTAGLSINHVNLTFITPQDFLDRLSPDQQLVAIETTADSKNLFQEPLPQKAIFFLGNERKGLPDTILERCTLKIHIPMTGACKSMNVSHALAVVLFEWQRQMLFPTSAPTD